MALVAGLMGAVSVVTYIGAGSMRALRHVAAPAASKG